MRPEQCNGSTQRRASVLFSPTAAGRTFLCTYPRLNALVYLLWLTARKINYEIEQDRRTGKSSAGNLSKAG